MFPRRATSNGDGFDDIIVGAPLFVRDADNLPGAAYVIFGKADGFGTVDLSDLDAADGFVIQGDEHFDYTGGSVSSAGDINGDGFDDLIIGAQDGGKAYVVFGKAGGFGADGLIDVTTLTAADGFVIEGGLGRYSSVSSAGDVNGDGFDDLFVGDPFDNRAGNDAGAAYILFGGAFGGDDTPVTTIGTDGDEILIGGLGDDTLTGGGGADVIRAGAGDDLLVVADIGFARIDGGTGFDTLALDGAGLHLDLTDKLPAEIASIEAIDLTGSGDNSLTLSQLDVFDITEERSGDTAILRVTGDAGDGVTFDEIDWTNVGSIAEGDVTYDRYVLGNAEVRVEQGVSVSFPQVIDLTGFGAPDGFVIIGDETGDQVGFSVSSAGDVNGDGFDDVIVGAPYGDDGGNKAGEAYVVFGKAGGFGPVDLGDIGDDGFVVQGPAASEYAGWSVSSAGDINGDGFDDLIVGVPGDFYSSPEGSAYVIFGKAAGFGPVDLSSLGVDQGFVIQGAGPGDTAGWRVSSAGDINGDGLDDLIVGAPFGDSGAAYVIFGKTEGFGPVDLSTLDASDGFVIQGAENFDRAGLSVSSAGDVNGDGFDDLIVSANGSGANNQGAAYVVFGKAGGFTDIDLGSGLAADDGFVVQGDAEDRAGSSVSSAGDINGDGLDDLIIGAIGNAFGGASGAAYVVFGKADGVGPIDLADGLTAEQGFAIQGDGAFNRTGISVSSAGDINGDGFDDLIVGALGNPFAGPGGAEGGADYVIFGKAEGFGTIDLANGLSAEEGFVIQGPDQGAYAGGSVSSAGDINGDGFDDLIVGAPAPYGTAEGYNGGAAYVIFGGAFGGAVTTTGTAAAEILIGSQGDDTLTGGGGADVIRAGAGDDLLSIGDTSFARLDGGSGFDTLLLDGAFDLDFTTIDSSSKVTGIEAIDLSGSGDNVLTLNAQDLLQLSDETSDLFVFGDSGDQVRLEGAFTDDGTEEVDGTTYNVYSFDGTEARLLAETDVAVAAASV